MVFAAWVTTSFGWHISIHPFPHPYSHPSIHPSTHLLFRRYGYLHQYCIIFFSLSQLVYLLVRNICNSSHSWLASVCTVSNLLWLNDLLQRAEMECQSRETFDTFTARKKDVRFSVCRGEGRGDERLEKEECWQKFTLVKDNLNLR